MKKGCYCTTVDLMLSEIGRHVITAWTWPEFSKQFQHGSYYTCVYLMTCKLFASILGFSENLNSIWLFTHLMLNAYNYDYLLPKVSSHSLQSFFWSHIVQFCLLIYNFTRESCNSCRIKHHDYILIMTRTKYLNSNTFNCQEFLIMYVTLM